MEELPWLERCPFVIIVACLFAMANLDGRVVNPTSFGTMIALLKPASLSAISSGTLIQLGISEVSCGSRRLT